MHPSKPTIRVVAAIILQNSAVYCFRRQASKQAHLSNKFEFPGGKVEPGENEKEALKREIQEELQTDIEIKNEFDRITCEYPDLIADIAFFICNLKGSEFNLTVHTEARLVPINELKALDWLEGSNPIIDKLIKGLV